MSTQPIIFLLLDKLSKIFLSELIEFKFIRLVSLVCFSLDCRIKLVFWLSLILPLLNFFNLVLLWCLSYDVIYFKSDRLVVFLFGLIVIIDIDWFNLFIFNLVFDLVILLLDSLSIFNIVLLDCLGDKDWESDCDKSLKECAEVFLDLKDLAVFIVFNVFRFFLESFKGVSC